MKVDLSTTYLGMNLKNPLVASSSPQTGQLDTLRQLEDAGASAVVLPSLFEEQVEHEENEILNLQAFGAESFPEAMSYFPELEDYNTGPNGYLRHVEEAKQTLSIPVIASFNGASLGGWTRYARKIQDAGADALELNIYLVPTRVDTIGAWVESQYVDIIKSVREEITIPLAVKIGPYFSSFANVAAQFVDAGADGLVLFNRYLQPDIDIEALTVEPQLLLSRPYELRVPLRWIAILHDQVKTSFAASSGIHSMEDVVKVLMAGADVAMLTSALLQKGPQYLGVVLKELSLWLNEHGYESVRTMQGSMSQHKGPAPESFERANYMKALSSYSSGHL